MKDTNFTGSITELHVLTYATEYGIIVSLPFGEHKYDQIWDIGGTLYKVQVKTARLHRSKKAFMFNCHTVSNGKKHKYTPNMIDYFATFWEGQCYVIPVSQCSTEKVLWFEENNFPHCCLAENFTLEEIFKK